MREGFLYDWYAWRGRSNLWKEALAGIWTWPGGKRYAGSVAAGIFRKVDWEACMYKRIRCKRFLTLGDLDVVVRVLPSYARAHV